MKRISLLLVAVMLLSFALTSCSGGKDSETTYQEGAIRYITETVDSDKVETYVTEGIDDFDSNGNLILTSTDNRWVYFYMGQYVIFKFNGKTTATTDVMTVTEHKSTEEAQEYLSANAVELMATGNYLKFEINGRYLIYYLTSSHPDYEKYFKGGKNTVSADFQEDWKQ